MFNHAYDHRWNKKYHHSTRDITTTTTTALNLQPDVTLIVGHSHNMVKFLAHKRVLSNHSGYFKTLFSSYDGYEIQVSTVNSFTFAYLLTFMYTGHLDLNPLNVYEIFLASNLLHIMEALNLCKQYLNENRNYAVSIVKPIPQKRFVPTDAHVSLRTLQYQPLRIHDEPSTSIFKPVRPATVQTEKVNENENLVNVGKREDENSSNSSRLAEHNLKKSESTSSSNTVIFDIACCDGPIKFRKVANEYYDPAKAIAITKNEGEFDAEAAACNGCKHVFKNYHPSAKYSPHDQNIASNIKNTTDRFNMSFANAVTEADSKFKKKQDNLQCYSCKTCGSKFPSYYFVHKHRKLHH